jgi:UDP-N-acetylmuramoyl-tripeptide--D-alanyl-D-alanine ligase
MLSLKELVEATNGVYINGDLEMVPENYVIDSRLVNKNDFFIPIIGENTDGHMYIIDCVKKGAIGFFISKNNINKDKIIQESIDINKNVCIVEVEDTFKSLYNAGKINREKNINIPVIAVTGSVGKTSTREMIASVLKQSKEVLVTEKNYNSLIGVPIMALKIDNQDVCVLEAGIDHFNEMELLSDVLKPDVCVITNIGTAHIGTFKSSENILKEKIQITNHIKGISRLIINEDNTFLSNVESSVKFDVDKIGMDNVSDIKINDDTIEFVTRVYGEKNKFTINALGSHNIYNALVAIKIGEIFKIKRDDIIKGISEYKNFARRLEKLVIKDNITLIDDTYNASIDSMKSGLITVNNLKAKRKIAVLGDMFDLGEKSEEIHEELAKVFEILDYDYIFTLGNLARKIAIGAEKYMDKNCIFCFDNKELLIEELKKFIKQDDIVYFKASNGMKFNEIINELKK